MKIKVQYQGGTTNIKMMKILDMKVQDGKLVEKEKIVNYGGKELPF